METAGSLTAQAPTDSRPSTSVSVAARRGRGPWRWRGLPNWTHQGVLAGLRIPLYRKYGKRTRSLPADTPRAIFAFNWLLSIRISFPSNCCNKELSGLTEAAISLSTKTSYNYSRNVHVAIDTAKTKVWKLAFPAQRSFRLHVAY